MIRHAAIAAARAAAAGRPCPSPSSASSSSFAAAAARRHQSTGAIFKNSVANKQGLSFALDGVMRSGAHDMRVFGLGTLRALVTQGTLRDFLASHMHFYHAMETSMDARPSDSPTGQVWAEFGDDLRRGGVLAEDLRVLGVSSPEGLAPTPATQAYVAAIVAAAQAEENGAPPLLLAHFYTRYLADLFGGSMLGWPTKWALRLDAVPGYYVHAEAVTKDRGAYIERVYEALNEAGGGLGDEGRRAVASEATAAFGHNTVRAPLPDIEKSDELRAEVYKEGMGGGGLGMAAMGAVREQEKKRIPNKKSEVYKEGMGGGGLGWRPWAR